MVLPYSLVTVTTTQYIYMYINLIYMYITMLIGLYNIIYTWKFVQFTVLN